MQHTLAITVLGLVLSGTATAAGRPEILRTPNGGIQPQAAIDGKGVLHLIYFKGKDSEGDVFYVHQEPGKQTVSEPIRVNSVPGSAIAVGSIRGGQLALGKGGRVHVAWNGAGKAMPMLYSRLDDAGKAFEPQRNLMTKTVVLDGGGTVAADSAGDVYVAWHALQAGSERGEINRKVWVAVSGDEGKSFAQEVVASTEPTGACGCCGMKGFVDRKGALHLLYRSASGGSRDMYLLTSSDQARSFTSQLVDRWKVGICPMSSEVFAEGPNGFFAAWDTDQQVYFARAETGGNTLAGPVGASGRGPARKHPALAVNDQGEMILVWTEGTGWSKGGSLVWQVHDKTGKPTEERGRIEGGVPVWGLPAVVSGPNDFVIIH